MDTRCNPDFRLSATAESITAAYSLAHESFVTLSRANDLMPFDLRLLVALEERGGSGRTDEIEVELQCEGSAVRRSYPMLERRGLLTADAGEGTLRPKRGTRSRLTLTAYGRDLARAVIQRANEGLEVAA